MAENPLLGLSPVQLISLIAAILTILAIGRQGIVTAKHRGPELIHRFRSVLWEAITERALRPFWESFLRDECTLVLPTKDHTSVKNQPIWMRTMFLDYFGAAHLMEELNTAFDTTNVGWTQSNTISQEQRNQNLISVAGPQPNHITATLLQQPEIVYRFPENDEASTAADYHGRIISETSHDTVFEPIDQDGDVKRDFGIITKMKNPYNIHRDAIIVCGVWGWGTKAGFELLTHEETLQYLIDEGGEYFQAIYSVTIDEQNRTTQPHLIDLHPDEQLRHKTIVSLRYDD